MSRFFNILFIFISGVIACLIGFVVAGVKIFEKSEMVREVISKVFTEKISNFLYNDSKRRGRSPYVSYRDYYTEYRNRNEHTKRGSKFDVSLPVFDTRADAEKILDRLLELLNDYGAVTVADFNDLSGVTSTFKDNTLGWTNLDNCYIIRVRGGYTIKLRSPIILK